MIPSLVAVGFDTLCRRSELIALRVENLEPNHFGTASLLILRAKNDPEGSGRIAHFSPLGLDALRTRMTAAENDQDPLLRPSTAPSSAPHPFSITRIIKKLAAAAGL